MMHRKHASVLVAGLMMSAALLCAVGVAAEEAGSSKPTPEESQAHYAKGEVHYGGKWVSMTGLLDSCRTTRAAIETELEKNKPGKERIAEITKAAAKMLAEWRTKKQPVERELAQAEAKRRLAQRVLSMRPPSKPNLVQDSGRSGWGGGWDSNSRYVEEQNRRRRQQYEQAMKRYNELRKQAKGAFTESDATITKCRKQLDELRTEFKDGQKPLLAERTKLTTESRSAGSRTGTLVNRLRAFSEVLRAVPEKFRLKQGIAQWQGAFYRVTELEELHASLAAEIQAARQAAEARLAGEGTSLPKTWKHAKQAQADALKALIAGTKADMAGAKQPQ